MIYTIGDKVVYEKARERSHALYKLGKSENYKGGYAFETIEQANLRINELEMQDIWIVFGLDTTIENTEISECGRYRNLVNDSKIIFLE